jgi:hypothetical protein
LDYLNEEIKVQNRVVGILSSDIAAIRPIGGMLAN